MHWIDALGEVLASDPAFRDHRLRRAGGDDENLLYALHREAMREHIDAVWGWNEGWQRAHFEGEYAPARNAVNRFLLAARHG